MKLPHLTQTIQLARGQADLVHQAATQVLNEMLERDPKAGQRLSIPEALSLKPLSSLVKRLLTLAVRDARPVTRTAHGKARRVPLNRFRVEADELATVRLFYGRLLATTHHPDHQLTLATALGPFHQCSLNLETHLRLKPATGPGAQAPLL